MSFLKPAICAAVIASVPTVASACIFLPPPLPFPGESDAAYEARHKAAFEAQIIEDRRAFQAAIFDKAESVSLARVTATRVIDAQGVPGNAIDAEPVEALKGPLPTGSTTLANRFLSTCGMSGGGSATGAKPGEYIIVFKGALFSEEPVAYGLTMTDLREPRLLQSVREAAIRLRDAAKSKEVTR